MRNLKPGDHCIVLPHPNAGIPELIDNEVVLIRICENSEIDAYNPRYFTYKGQVYWEIASSALSSLYETAFVSESVLQKIDPPSDKEKTTTWEHIKNTCGGYEPKEYIVTHFDNVRIRRVKS